MQPKENSHSELEEIEIPTKQEVRSIASDIELLFAGQEKLLGDFEALQQSFDTKVKYDGSKQKIIDTLHAELQTYRDGLHYKLLRPVFIDLIALHDDAGNLIDATNNGSDEVSDSEHRLMRSVATFQHSIEDILDRYGVEIYTEDETKFNAQRQRSVRRISTGDPEQDRQISQSLRSGFAYENKVLRPELVATYRYKQPEETTKSQEN